MSQDLYQQAINTARALSIEAIEANGQVIRVYPWEQLQHYLNYISIIYSIILLIRNG